MGAAVTTRSVVSCDQCGAEAATTAMAAAGWHSLNLHDLTIGRQVQVDICGQCCTTMDLRDLFKLVSG